jgi:hypothetical protein
MLRTVAAKVAWVGRTASMVFGLALVLALLFGVASMALAGTGPNGVFNLGVKNTVNALTQLVSNPGVGPAGPMLRVDNNSSATGATGLQILTEAGKPPMTVNRATRVTNLNADKVDGKDAPLWANINADGLTPSYYGLTGNTRTAEGRYDISFNRDVSKCATVATNKNQYGEISASTRNDTPNTANVEIVTSNHLEWQDGAFALVVTC